MGANIFDLITVTRKSRPYKVMTIKAASKEMVLNGSKVVFSIKKYASEKPQKKGKK